MNALTVTAAKPYRAKYWGNKGKHQALYNRLWKLVPEEGECAEPNGKDEHLDILRRASKYYYDLFSNGLCNYLAEARDLFGFDPPYSEEPREHDERCDCCDAIGRPATEGTINFKHPDIANYDKAMDRFILAAAKEQGIK